MKDGIPRTKSQAHSAIRQCAVNAPPCLGAAWRSLLLLLMLALATTVRAQLNYTVANGEVTITGYTGTAGDLTIPDTLEGLPVTTIDSTAFNMHGGLTGITIPDSVLRIYFRAFENCPALTHVTLGKGVSIIGPEVFAYCTNLASLTVAPDNTSFCSVEGVLFNRNKTWLVQYPPARAATEYLVPESVTYVADYAFSLCRGLTKVLGGSPGIAIGNHVFEGCTAMTSNSLIGQAKSIGIRAFDSCSALVGSLSLNQANDIGDYAFYGCAALTSVSLPSGSLRLGSFAFAGCTHVSRFEMPAGASQFICVDGVLFDFLQTRLIQYPGAKPGAGYQLPNRVSIIDEGAFSSGAGTPSLTLPGTVTTLSSSAFSSCPGLASITLPDSITEIPYHAFYNCTSLTNVSLSPQVTQIGHSAFAGCTSLKAFTIPAGVSKIEPQAFQSCTNLASFTVDPSNTSFASVEGVLFDRSLKQLLWYPIARDATTYAVPGGVTQLGDFAFNGCSRLTQVTFPETVTYLGGSVFGGCNGLSSFTLPRTVTAVGPAAFGDCTNLTHIVVEAGNPSYTSVDGALIYTLPPDRPQTNQVVLAAYPAGSKASTFAIPPGVILVENGAFAGSAGLVSLTIPASVQHIETEVFDRCTGLARVYFEGDLPTFPPSTFQDTPATLYYRPDRMGWRRVSNVRPVVPWNPGILTDQGPPDHSGGHLSLTLRGAAGVPLVVETCEDLGQASWFPVSTNTCNAEGLAQFSDPALTDLPGRFYRFRAQ